MKKIIFGLICLFSSNIFASSLFYTITNEPNVSSEIKLKNKDDINLTLTCNNFFNQINVSLVNVNESDFYSSNIFHSKTMFGKSFNKNKWNGVYDNNGKFFLKLDSDGLVFTKNLYKSGKILLDMKELKGVKLFEADNKSQLRKYLDLSLSNCGIYL